MKIKTRSNLNNLKYIVGLSLCYFIFTNKALSQNIENQREKFSNVNLPKQANFTICIDCSDDTKKESASFYDYALFLDKEELLQICKKKRNNIEPFFNKNLDILDIINREKAQEYKDTDSTKISSHKTFHYCSVFDSSNPTTDVENFLEAYIQETQKAPFNNVWIPRYISPQEFETVWQEEEPEIKAHMFLCAQKICQRISEIYTLRFQKNCRSSEHYYVQLIEDIALLEYSKEKLFALYHISPETQKAIDTRIWEELFLFNPQQEEKQTIPGYFYTFTPEEQPKGIPEKINHTVNIHTLSSIKGYYYSILSYELLKNHYEDLEKKVSPLISIAIGNTETKHKNINIRESSGKTSYGPTQIYTPTMKYISSEKYENNFYFRDLFQKNEKNIPIGLKDISAGYAFVPHFMLALNGKISKYNGRGPRAQYYEMHTKKALELYENFLKDMKKKESKEKNISNSLLTYTEEAKKECEENQKKAFLFYEKIVNEQKQLSLENKASQKDSAITISLSDLPPEEVFLKKPLYNDEVSTCFNLIPLNSVVFHTHENDSLHHEYFQVFLPKKSTLFHMFGDQKNGKLFKENLKEIIEFHNEIVTQSQKDTNKLCLHENPKDPSSFWVTTEEGVPLKEGDCIFVPKNTLIKDQNALYKLTEPVKN